MIMWLKYFTCLVRRHDWFSCGIRKPDDTWMLYWRCDRCANAVVVEQTTPAPRLLPADTKPRAHAVV